MERRGQDRELGLPNSMGYTTPPVIHESPVKLPLAPIFSTPPDRRGNPFISPRRGTSIFSPSQTLDQPYNNPAPPPPFPAAEQRQQQQQQQVSLPPPPVQREPSPDPDPPPSSANATAAAPAAAAGIKYRECLKNHAASIGGHVVDGCGEFMPSGNDGTPESFRCAACDCHRNFHRKEFDGEPNYHPYNPAAAAAAQPVHGQITYSSMPPHHRHRHRHRQKHSQALPAGSAPPSMVNFGGSAAAESSSEDLNMFQSSGGGSRHTASQSSKKRFRTKFSQDQKDRMQEFASKIGWRIQKQDEQEVQQFCTAVGVKRQVFKVWMHNNKQALKKKQS